MLLKEILFGISTYFPFIQNKRKNTTGGSNNARYCYSVWMRHMIKFHQKKGCLPQSVAEIGPGDSLGMGLCALLSGCKEYIGLDIVDYHVTEKNLSIFDELLMLFRNKSDIPSNEEFPEIKPPIEDYQFPEQIVTNDILSKTLSEHFIETIKKELMFSGNNQMIKYFSPWDNYNIIQPHSVDLIFSQAVLEHIDKLPEAYQAMSLWIKKDALISHQIDFKSHKLTNKWNGHWAINKLVWKIVRGKRPFLINRYPLSYHKQLMKDNGFSIIQSITFPSKNSISRKQLYKDFCYMTDEDFQTSGVFIQAELNE